MEGADRDRTESGFKVRTPVAEARRILGEAVEGVERDRTLERVPIEEADGRVLAERVTAKRNVPHYERAAMDGYAVRAEDTFGASARSPAVLRTREREREGDDTAVDPGAAVRVHTGSDLPTGADAVVMIEHVEELEATGELEVEDAVAEGENVAPVGEDVTEGDALYEPGHRLRPSDLGLLKSVGRSEVAVVPRPTAGVIPTGEELVQSDPGPGEVIETNGLTVSHLVERWGGRATYRDVVTDDPEALRVAIQRDLTKDVVVTTGGSSVGERDLLPEVIDDLGKVLVHGVGLKPGHPVCLGVVEDTPVLALPGYPVACIVNAVQFLRPTLRWLEGVEPDPHPTTEAVLERKIPSEPGTRTFARVRLEARDDDESDGGEGEGPDYAAIPTRASGSGVLSSVALADGWVVVEEEREGIPAGETVAVEDWEPGS
ncbi:gephyrin-like molybdotransferase Glp [Natrialbaceae archaeon GCM10025810]|uniref:molybdopterin molybdotransferase MoeA n=1 Tax=Halovalidus salilacus TaxID=3075124 RepID=UPI0036108FDE